MKWGAGRKETEKEGREGLRFEDKCRKKERRWKTFFFLFFQRGAKEEEKVDHFLIGSG